MTEPFRITDWRKQPGAAGTRVSASLDGYEVWFESPGFATARESGDAFLAVALLAAMAQHRPLDLREAPPVSTCLLERLDDIQSLWTQWNPWLRRIPVHARDVAAGVAEGPRHGTFFSGGVDATHAVVAGGGRGELLAFIGGFDYLMTDEEFAHSLARVGRLAERLEGDLVPIRTNWIRWRRELRLSASLMHGGALVACGHLLDPARMTIASSNSWARMTPWGTHPFHDPLWSSTRTAIRHFGCDQTRVDKLVVLVQQPELLADLWICHAQAIGNCGRCNKCLRTRAMLHLLGADVPVNPDARDVDAVGRYAARFAAGAEQIFSAEFRRLAAAQGKHDAVARILAGERNLMRRKVLRDVRRLLFPGRAARIDQRQDLLPWGYGPIPESM